MQLDTVSSPAAQAAVRQPGSPFAALIRALLSYRVMLAAGLVTVCCMTISGRFNDPDMWWHLKLGQIMWDTHSIPTKDMLSFTAYGQASMPHEWLAQVSIYAAYRLGGYTGLMVWFSALTSLLFVLVYVLCYLGSRNALLAFFGGLAAWFFGTVGMAIRPLILGHICLALELILLELGSRNRRWLWLLPPLFAVWVNCHGSYFFGIGALFVYWICARVTGKWGPLESEGWDRKGRNALGAVLVLSAIALCCNPVGVRLAVYPLNMMFFQPTNLNAVEEWFPPDLRDGRTLSLLAVAAAIVIVPLWRRTEIQMRDLLLALAAFGLALQHSRMLLLFGIVASPILCRSLAPYMQEKRKRDHPIANGLFIAAFLSAAVWAFPNQVAIHEQIRKANPVGAVEYIRRAGLTGPMLNEYVLGGYLTWAHPEEKVFIDGQAEVFEWTGVLAEYGRWATLAEDPQILLDRRGIRLCLLSSGSPMRQVVRHLPGWRQAYADNVAVVYAR